MSEYKRLKDPIYGYINIPNAYAKDIIDTPAFQRLRRIVQTSYAPLYASAVHNRFVHSLGVFHLGEIACNSIISQWSTKYGSKAKLNDIKKTFLLACLLHDIGHAPFSHTGENFYLDDVPNGKYQSLHQKLVEVVDSPEFTKDVPKTDVGAAAPHEIMSAILGIQQFRTYIGTNSDWEFFARCITGYKYSDPGAESSLYNCFISLLNSKIIDLDRLDYLIRDAFFTGFDTVNIDYERLLTSLTVIKVPAEDKGNGKGTEPEHYELAYNKNAISIIENVVYAHDSERKWIQSHPVILYDSYILQHVMAKLNKDLSWDGARLFSLEALSEEGCTLSDETRIALLCDDDIICLMKNKNTDSLSKEYFNRKDRRHPIWKSEAEYRAYLKLKLGDGDIFDGLKQALADTEKYLRQGTDSWVIDKSLIEKVKSEKAKAEAEKIKMKSEKTTLDKKKESDLSSIEKQIKEKNNIIKVLKVLNTFPGKGGERSDYVLLSAKQFSSNFNRPDISNINIVFPTEKGDEIRKLGAVVSLLNGDDSGGSRADGSKPKTEDFFYLYIKTKTRSSNKSKLFRGLINAFT